MDQYYRNHNISSNVKNSVILTKHTQNDNEKGDSVLMNMWNTIYKKNISPGNKMAKKDSKGDNSAYNYSNKTIDLRSKVSFQNPVIPRSNVIKIKNQKISHIKRRILESGNNNYEIRYANNTYNSYNISYNKGNYDSYKNKYKNRNFNKDNDNLNNDEPFFLNDKHISNSFVVNLEEKFKNSNNNKGNESNSKLLDKDLPSSLNNTQKYFNQKYGNDESNSKSNSNKKYLNMEYPKEVNAFRLRDKNVTFEVDKISIAKNALNYNKIKNVNYDINSSYNNSINNNNIKLNTFKIMNARRQNNRNNISSNLTFENSFNNIEFKNTRAKPVRPVFPIRYFYVNQDEVLDHVNNESNKNSKNNSKIFKKIPTSIENFNQADNSNKKSEQPSEIESCVISFRNAKKAIKIKNMKPKLNYSQNESSNYIKKKIDLDKNESNVKRRIVINDNKGNELNNTTYKLYKKPSLALKQNIYNENNQNNQNNGKKVIDDYYSQSYFNTYNKIGDSNKNNNNNNDIFNKRQYLGNMHKGNKNPNNKSFSIQNKNVFIKKTISPAVTLNNNRTSNNSPIYAKKIPQSLSKIHGYNSTNNSNINDKKDSPKKEMKFRCFITDPNETKWCSRYGRPGYVKSSKNEEDEKYLKEHFKNLEKKEDFNFDSMEKNHTHIYLKNNEILDGINNKIDSFKNIDFHPLIKKNLDKLKFDLMTPIQKAIIPYILDSKDCLGCAETGSGKTIAFLAPIISLLLKEERYGSIYYWIYSHWCDYRVCGFLHSR